MTPPINSTETIQVATPFSFSFTYSTVITTSDTPVYYFGNSVFGSCNNSTIIKCLSDQNPTSGYGLTYTVSNMNAVGRELEGDVLKCILPIPVENFKFESSTYVTFGGPNRLYIQSTIADPSNSLPALYTATFGGMGPFAYGLDGSTEDSLQYIPLAATPGTTGPAVSFKIKLTRPNISNCSVRATITDNVLRVISMFGSYPGQVTVGMVFPLQGSLPVACTVTAYGAPGYTAAYGGPGYYTVTRNSGTGNINMEEDNLNSSYVTGSGDVLLSNSMTPSDGTAKFEIYTNFTYDPIIYV